MNLTEDQLFALAPDEASKKAGKDLANPAKWLTKGATETAVWGECQGSGSKPYQTAIDLSNIAFKCSCPSRKFPCKHGMALGLLYARRSDDFKTTEAPPWLTEWLSKRVQKADAKEEKKDKPVDEAAQAKRQQAREGKVADGVEELLLWIKDLVRSGLIGLPDKPYSFWEGMSRRMIDAQAPGLAGMIKTMYGISNSGQPWQSGFLDTLLNLYLVAKGYQNKEGLPHLIHDIRSWIGFTVSQDELKEQSGVLDTWLVTGKQVSEDEGITVERNWLYGLTTGKHALVLQFIVRGGGANLLLSPGMYIEAELVFYPSVAPVRAIVKRQITAAAKMLSRLYPSWTEVAQAETALCSSFPVRSERPHALSQITPVKDGNVWWLKDAQHNAVRLKEGFNGLWNLLSLSGGAPMDAIVIGKEGVYEPLGVWAAQTYKPV